MFLDIMMNLDSKRRDSFDKVINKIQIFGEIPMNFEISDQEIVKHLKERMEYIIKKDYIKEERFFELELLLNGLLMIKTYK